MITCLECRGQNLKSLLAHKQNEIRTCGKVRPYNANWRLLISINWISSTKEMNHITRKSMSKLVMQPSFRAVNQTHAEWQTFEKPENNRNVWQSGMVDFYFCGIARLLICNSNNQNKSLLSWRILGTMSEKWFMQRQLFRVFGLQLWNLALLLSLTCSFSWWGSFLCLMKFNLC